MFRVRYIVAAVVRVHLVRAHRVGLPCLGLILDVRSFFVSANWWLAAVAAHTALGIFVVARDLERRLSSAHILRLSVGT